MDYQLYGSSDILLNENSDSKNSWDLPSNCSMDSNEEYFGWSSLKIDEENIPEEETKTTAKKRKLQESEIKLHGRTLKQAPKVPKDPLYIENKCIPPKKASTMKGGSRMPHWQVEDYGDLNNDIDSSLTLSAELASNSYNVNEAILNINSLTVFKQEAPSPTSNEMTQLQMPRPNRLSPTSTQQAPVNSTIDDNNTQNMFNNTINQLLSQSNLANIHNVMDNNNLTTSPNSQDSYAVSSTNYNFIEDSRFQYVLAAATSIATKQNEDTLTYLNQGQSYEIKLKKLGDLSLYRGKTLKSVVRICFHERRLQYMEKEQMISWQKARPGDRVLEVDVPLSYGAFDIVQPSNAINVIHFSWDPTKEIGVYIKVNCISTEFTPKKHGGEKGVPFRIQVETYNSSNGPGSGVEDTSKRLHAAACQIKVFKLKGADRKHKQDREKIMKRPLSEQEKYQPSYDCTVLSDIPNDAVLNTTLIAPLSPVAADSNVPQKNHLNQLSPRNFDNHQNPVVIPQKQKAVLPAFLPEKNDELKNATEIILTQNSSPEETMAWLTVNRFEKYLQTFARFSGADMLRMSREDFMQICGNADGIRLHNALHLKTIAPKLKIYVCRENTSVFNAIFLSAHNNVELLQKLSRLVGVAQDQVRDIYIEGPQSVHVQLNNDVLQHIKEETMFILQVIHENDNYAFLLKKKS